MSELIYLLMSLVVRPMTAVLVGFLEKREKGDS